MILREFGLDKISMGWSVSAFNWAYAIFQVPGGWMADLIGASLATRINPNRSAVESQE